MRLHRIGVIQKASYNKEKFISSYFLVPKPNGRYRFILNLKKFNEFVPTIHFKMEDIRTVINILEENDFLCSNDFNNYYYKFM